MVDIVAWIGAIALIFVSVPQAVKIIQTKSANDVSAGTFFLIFVVGISFTIKGASIDEPAIYVPNAISSFMAMIVLGLRCAVGRGCDCPKKRRY